MDSKDLENKSSEGKTSPLNVLTKRIYLNLSGNLQSTTELDLSKRNIEELDANIILPPCLQNINISHNKLERVPQLIINLKELKVLDVSYNKIEYFNNCPGFCHAIECLNLSHNVLKCPPCWVWSETPRNLTNLDISGNMHISESPNFDLILQYNTLVTQVILYNCRLGKHLNFLGTFPKAEMLELGTPDWSCYAANHLQEVPCQGLDKCCDIQRLKLANTHVYTVNPNINIFKNVIEINLSHNNLNGLPNEFCELENLEICVLSFNNILYLPDNFVKLKKLITLCLDVNELCKIPQNINELTNLTTLDLYDNNIYEIPDGIMTVHALDLGQNYFDEPDDQDYLNKREKIRLHKIDRQNGRKYEVEKPESLYSSDTTDDEEFIPSMRDAESRAEEPPDPPSSPEDWDSDSYWVPNGMHQTTGSHTMHWLSYVKKKMKDGNLCPMDRHQVSIVEKVKYEKMCYPVEVYESDGQFDDFSEDDSSL